MIRPVCIILIVPHPLFLLLCVIAGYDPNNPDGSVAKTTTTGTKVASKKTKKKEVDLDSLLDAGLKSAKGKKK